MVRYLFIPLSVVQNLVACYWIFKGTDGLGSSALWLLSILFFFLTFSKASGVSDATETTDSQPRWLVFLLLAGVILLAVGVRAVLVDPHRTHDDEFIVGFFSANEPLLKGSFFSGIPADWTDWVCQFPKPYFLLQKLFFNVFGEGIYQVKYSVLPYVALITLLIFRITCDLYGWRPAVVAACFYAFQPLSVYLETMGLHFVSSTAVFLVFSWCLLNYLQNPKATWAARTGLGAGLCYLTYTSSYIALPVMTTAFVLLFLVRPGNRWRTVREAGIAFGGTAVVLAPFASYAVFRSNYFFQRIDQVQLFAAEKDDVAQHGAWSVYHAHFERCFQSLYTDGIGGHGGYDFGNLPLLDPWSRVLLVLGAVSCLILVRRIPLSLYFPLIVIVAFISGMTLTFPPPAYHRFSVALPLLAILFSLPFVLLWRIQRIPSLIPAVLAAGTLFFYAKTNVAYFHAAVLREKPHQEIQLSELINREYHNRQIYVAAFPSFAFEKNYYFAPGRSPKPVITQYHREILKQLNRSEKYVVVINSPYEIGTRETIWEKVFADADPNAHIVSFSDKYSLLVN